MDLLVRYIEVKASVYFSLSRAHAN